MQGSKLTFDISATGPELTLVVRLDGKEFYRGEPGPDVTKFSAEFDDDLEITHVLEIEMYGKTKYHTRVDASGNIIEDRRVRIDNIALDDIMLGQIVPNLSKYSHDHNGSSGPVVVPFYQEMGCNGSVRLEFNSPIYLWLLENI